MLSKNSIELLNRRYCRPGEGPEDVFKRVSEVLEIPELLPLMLKGKFLPNSPVLWNAGYNNFFHACCVMPIEDNMESIASFRYRMTMMFKYGAGVGANYSQLRPVGSSLSTGGKSSGIVSLLKAVNQEIAYVSQGGYRRGACMSILNWNHPEIIDFIMCKLKGGFENMNLSVMVTNEFMESLETNKTNKDIFDIISFCAWACGCPGILFFNRINEDNKFYPEIIIDGTNPCSESPLINNSLCTLGSINLSRHIYNGTFSFDNFLYTIRVAVPTLLKINKMGWYPFPEMQENMEQYKPIGLGVMGFADALIKLGIYYDSNEALDFIDQIGIVLKKETNEICPDSFYHNIIAPTGSLSILADCSSGIEPVFSNVFERNLTVGKIEETRDFYKSKYLRIAHEIEPEWHVKILSRWQQYIDGGVSKTVNMPKEATVEDVRNIFSLAWKTGCKGVSIFRETSKEGVLRKIKCEGEECGL